jgi:hypothetical protein
VILWHGMTYKCSISRKKFWPDQFRPDEGPVGEKEHLFASR